MTQTITVAQINAISNALAEMPWILDSTTAEIAAMRADALSRFAPETVAPYNAYCADCDAQDAANSDTIGTY